jgi:hypothetical protein
LVSLLLGFLNASPLFFFFFKRAYRFRCAEFQAIFKDYFNLRGKIPKLLKDFEDAATKIGKIIISERNMPNKTIPPLGKGELGSVLICFLDPWAATLIVVIGVAGGEKYLCGTIFFKYAVDLFNIYGGDHFAQVANMFFFFRFAFQKGCIYFCFSVALTGAESCWSGIEAPERAVLSGAILTALLFVPSDDTD